MAFLAVPVLLKTDFEDENEEVYYCASQIQGWRDHMEDYIAVKLNFCNKPNWHYFAVFDGHIDEHVAQYCSEELPKYLESKICEIIENADQLESVGDKCARCIEETYLEFDEILRNKGLRSGSTCTSILMGPDFYLFANVGDSRSFIISDDQMKFATGIFFLTISFLRFFLIVEFIFQCLILHLFYFLSILINILIFEKCCWDTV